MNQTHRIFLVDDDTKHLLLLKDFLERHSPYKLDIRLFSSGENCLDKLDELPEIVVLDYHLDGIRPGASNGLEILKELRRRRPDADVIMMSSQDQLQVGLNTLEFGATDYVIKGETALLRAELVIRRILERKAAERFRQAQALQLRWLYAALVATGLTIIGLAVFAI
ncbi:MAG: response regulator [Bacteroidetes bacterium]|nr:response regulator [Bacteroidota bacterium]